MNMDYSLKNIEENTLIEARLTGPVRNDDWVGFFDMIAHKIENTKRLYMLIDENKFENDINYETARALLKKASNVPIKEFIISFSTSDPLKVHVEKLFRAMAKIADVPLAISYRLSLAEARNVITSLCLSCYTKMSSIVKNKS